MTGSLIVVLGILAAWANTRTPGVGFVTIAEDREATP